MLPAQTPTFPLASDLRLWEPILKRLMRSEFPEAPEVVILALAGGALASQAA